MPRMYEAIRDDCINRGGDPKDCAKKAARIFNARRAQGEKPLSPAYHKKGPKPLVPPR